MITILGVLLWKRLLLPILANQDTVTTVTLLRRRERNTTHHV